MTASASGHGDQTIRAFLNGLFGKAVVDDVVEHDPTIAVNSLIHLGIRPKGGNDEGHFVLHAEGQVLHEAIVRLVDDKVHREGRRGLLRVRSVMLRQRGLNLRQPLIEPFQGARVERRKGSHDAGLALGNDQLGIRNNEQGRCHGGQGQAPLENGG